MVTIIVISIPDENFLELEAYSNDAAERLETELSLLEPNPKCEGLDNFIDELVSLFDRFCPDPSRRESHEFSEKELKKLIFIQMKDRYP